MPNSDLLPSLLYKINENQLTLEAAIMELTKCVEQRGSAELPLRAWRPSGNRPQRGVHQDDTRAAPDARVTRATVRRLP